MLRSSFTSRPEPLFAALGRLMAAASAALPPAAVGASPAPASSSPSALLPKLQSLVALVLQQGLAAAGTGQRSTGKARTGPLAFAAVFARAALLGPGGCAQLSEDIKVRQVVATYVLLFCKPSHDLRLCPEPSPPCRPS